MKTILLHILPGHAPLYVRRVPILGAQTKVHRTDASQVKDELVVEGNDISQVSQTCANVHCACLVKKKDIRKFLDGIYVTVKENVSAPSTVGKKATVAALSVGSSSVSVRAMPCVAEVADVNANVR